MQVRLVSYSQPTEEFKQEGIEDVQDLVAFCARVSNPSNQYNTETSDRLITYLCNHKHWSPLEMASACLEIDSTRDIIRQFLRHRSFSFQEFSQRYADPTKDLKFILREARLQDTKNRQNSIELDINNPEHERLMEDWMVMQGKVVGAAMEAYTWAIDHGLAKEVARAVLPEGLMGSRVYANGTIRSWIHYIDVRSEEGTQKEHRDIALAVAKAITEIFPMSCQFVHNA